MYLKDLKVLEGGRNLSEIVIVDNTVASYYLNMENGIPIIDFEGNPNEIKQDIKRTYADHNIVEEFQLSICS